ncbi:hypothetical protein JW848_11005 [Candidatus Bipolaricaulota bacterium]|nr:hypothetical protein [Candidatus Bipolaricaulota bacterium]
MRENELLEKGEEAIRDCIDRVSFLKIRDFQAKPELSGRHPDFLVRLETSGGEFDLIVEAKSSGQPRIARQAIDRLHVYSARVPNPYAVLLAPYISGATARLCESEGVGYIDLAGNCRLSFGQVYIEQRGKENPYSEKRELRSLYSPKSERVLRVLLTARQPAWKVEELAAAADVSLGLVSKVKRVLEDREWLDAHASGMRLRDPEASLREWAIEYHYRKHQARQYYSFSSGADLERSIAAAAHGCETRIAFTGFSAAVRYAPAVRYNRSMVFCTGDAACLAEAAKLKPVESGANLTILMPYDEGVFYGSELRDGIPVVSAVQAYIDVAQQAARGEEAAAALLEEVIRNQW